MTLTSGTASASRLLAAFCAALVLLCTGSVQAATPLFEEDTPLELRLSGPFERIDKERDKEQIYRGRIRWQGDSGEQSLDLKYEVRGNFRLRRRVCDHVPLWLDFDKDEVGGTLFEGQNRLKLVVQCKDFDRYQGYLAREEQAYRMFRELSDLSLATRLAWVTYVDEESGEQRRQLAFLVQHHKEFARARGLELFEESSRFSHTRLDRDHGALVALFMYMVSNTDYSMVMGAPDDNCCHNTKPLLDSSGTIFAMPYDFDSTGYVDASYAETAEQLGQSNVRDRLYRGYCIHNESVPQAIARLQEKKPSVLQIAGETRFVSEREARNATRFIEKFYDVIDSEKRTGWEITGPCLG